MPLKISWTQKDYLSIALMLLGGCGLFQAVIIFIAQYFLSIGNYLIVIIIPIGATLALFYCTIIIFDSYAQVERRRKARGRFQKSTTMSKIQKFLDFPVVKPLLIVFIIFLPIFFLSYTISYLFLSNFISFVIAENVACIICLLISNLIEKKYARVRRY